MLKYQNIFEVVGSAGDKYDVFVKSNGKHVYMSCSCPASDFNTLCHHIMEVITDNPEVLELLKETGQWQVYEKHLAKLEEAKKIKREAAALKKQFGRELMTPPKTKEDELYEQLDRENWVEHRLKG